jgi:hypothetical protein
LTGAQEKELKRLLCEKNPRQLKLPFALWNRRAIQSAIYQLWRVRIAIRTIGDYMKRWGFTPQKPIKKAYEQSSKAVQEWLDNTYPEIKKLAKTEGAEIYWGDETEVRNDCQHSRGYAPRGQTPVVEINAKRFSVNMVSAINNLIVIVPDQIVVYITVGGRTDGDQGGLGNASHTKQCQTCADA